jgi:hypothetical protein
MPLTPAERKIRAQIAANDSWAQTDDRPARTAKARKALDDKFLTEADGDPKRAESLRKAYYARMAFKSAKARRLRAEARQSLTEFDVTGADDGAA